MVPAAFTGDTVMELARKMEPGDIIIDGGNSYYRDDIDRAKALAEMQIHYVDCGTSGGVFGLERGFCLMIGGEDDVVAHLDPIFKTIAPGVDTAPRTPGLTGEPSTAENGYLHCGPNGAGHFVKMVHNGIEYGMMAAYAEGLNVLKHANAGKQKRDEDAETTPLRDPQYYQYDLDIPAVAEVWRRGSVVASWLLDLAAHAFSQSPTSTTSPVGCPTRAKAAGPRSPRSTRVCRSTCSAQRCSTGSSLAGRPTSRTRSSLRCARNSAATTRRRADVSGANRADALCWFGCSGDLGHKMTFPALYAMARRGHLHVPVIGVAYSHWTLDDLKDRARDSIEKFGGGITDAKAWDHLMKSLHYVDGDYADPVHLQGAARASSTRSARRSRRTTSRSRRACSAR